MRSATLQRSKHADGPDISVIHHTIAHYVFMQGHGSVARHIEIRVHPLGDLGKVGKRSGHGHQLHFLGLVRQLLLRLLLLFSALLVTIFLFLFCIAAAAKKRVLQDK